MTNLAWLAAVLSPFEVAPHPNFGASPGFRPEADLAAVVLGDQPSWESFERRIGVAKAHPDEVVDDGVRGVHAALYEGLNSAPSTELLHDLEYGALDDDPARRTALTLLMCFIAGANDMYVQCETILRRALSAIAGDDSTSMLCRAALLQQLAFRKTDAGEDGEEDSISAASVLKRINIEDIDEFGLNGVTPLTAHDVARRMHAALVRATWSTVPLEAFDPNGRGPIPSRRDQLFSGRSDRLSQIVNNELVEYSRLVEKSYDDLFRRTSQTTMGYRPPDLFFEMLAYEAYGHAGASQVRRQLSMMRLTRTFPSFAGTNVSDCIRLFRHSGSEAELRKLIDNILYGGPLEAIVDDARRILSQRNRREAIRVVELVVLEAAADLLTTAESVDVLNLIFAVLDAGGPHGLPGRWQVDSKQYGTTWDAAVAVGEATGSLGRVAENLLQSASSERMADELWDRAYAKAIRRIDWENVPNQVIEGWREFFRREEMRDKIAARALDERVPPVGAEDPLPSEMTSLSEYADGINWYLRRGDRIPKTIVDGGARSAIEAMDRMLTEASNRTYARRVPDPAEILSVLLIDSSDQKYWHPMLLYLSDESLAHAAKERSFNLLAENSVDIDEKILAQYHDRMAAAALAPDPMAMGDDRESVIFPAAMRFAGVYGILDESTLFNFVCTLASSNDRKNKFEAARTVTALAKTPRCEWLETLALQLSFELFSDVRVEAVRCLSQLMKRDRVSTPAVVDRLLQLLDSDGITVPLAVLNAIPEDAVAADPLRAKALAMRTGHVSRRVREEAALVRPRPPLA